MSNKFISIIVLLAGIQTIAAQGTAFTYQGRLTDGGSPANGAFDIEFRLFNAASGGIQQGANLTANDLAISNGLFAATLDFGAGVFDGGDRWLEIALRPGASNGAFTNLVPRQRITASPYAIRAASVTWGGVSGVPVILTSNMISSVGSNALELKVNGERALRLEPGGSPNLIGGSLSNTVSAGVVGAFIGGGGTNSSTLNNRVTDAYGTVGGGLKNRAGDDAGTTSDRRFATVGGGYDNSASGANSTVAGGFSNNALGGNATVGGGTFNNAQGTDSTIAGGSNNQVTTAGQSATIAGGGQNLATGLYAVVGGGHSNIVRAEVAFIGAGRQNTIGAEATAASVTAGERNEIGSNSKYSQVHGGLSNHVMENSWYSSIVGGMGNSIGPGSGLNVIGGGDGNSIATDCIYGVIGGGYGNQFATGMRHSTIAGGFLNKIGTNSGQCSIGGGEGNKIGQASPDTTIAGGIFNDIGTNSPGGAIGGGSSNTIADNSTHVTIGGGYFNSIGTNSSAATIGGGRRNVIDENSFGAVVSGGDQNEIGAAGYATIGGGNLNVILANSHNATIAGGLDNFILANSRGSVIGGGYRNAIGPNAPYGTIPGGSWNYATNYAFAAGFLANAQHTGAFVWADSTPEVFGSTSANQFLVRASGGVGIGTPAPAAPLHVKSSADLPLLKLSQASSANWCGFNMANADGGAWDIDVGFGVAPPLYFYTGSSERVRFENNGICRNGSGTWSTLSDRRTKKDIRPMEAGSLDHLLRLTGVTFEYLTDKQCMGYGGRRRGWVAQEVEGVFPEWISKDSDGMKVVTPSGFDALVVEALRELRAEKDGEINQLKQRLDALEQIVRNLKSN